MQDKIPTKESETKNVLFVKGDLPQNKGIKAIKVLKVKEIILGVLKKGALFWIWMYGLKGSLLLTMGDDSIIGQRKSNIMQVFELCVCYLFKYLMYR